MLIWADNIRKRVTKVIYYPSFAELPESTGAKLQWTLTRLSPWNCFSGSSSRLLDVCRQRFEYPAAVASVEGASFNPEFSEDPKLFQLGVVLSGLGETRIVPDQHEQCVPGLVTLIPVWLSTEPHEVLESSAKRELYGCVTMKGALRCSYTNAKRRISVHGAVTQHSWWLGLFLSCHALKKKSMYKQISAHKFKLGCGILPET